MKKIIFLSFCVAFSAFGQTTIDFEVGGVGAGWAWTVDANGANTPMEFVANPNPTAVNSTDVTAKFTASPNGQPWALAYTDEAGSITFTESNSLVKMSVLKTVATTVAIKFEDSTNPAFFTQIEVANTLTNGEWEELSFDFSMVIGNSYDRMVIIPDFLERSEPNLVYFDQISFNSGGAVEDYSLQDIDFESDGFGANWVWTVHNNHSNPGFEMVSNPNNTGINSTESAARFTSLAEGAAWALTFTDNIGTFLFNQNNKIVSMMVLKTVASNVGIKFELIDTTNGQVVYDKELQLPTTLTNGDWELLHFDFSSEIGTAYNRLVIIPDFADRSQDQITYIDQISFGSTAGLQDTGLDSIKLVPNPARDWVELYGNFTDHVQLEIFDLQGKSIKRLTAVDNRISISHLKSGLYFVKFELAGQITTKKLVVY